MTKPKWFAVCYQETGEEGIIHPKRKDDGTFETHDEVIARIPEEWRFRYFEAERDYYAEAQKRFEQGYDDNPDYYGDY